MVPTVYTATSVLHQMTLEKRTLTVWRSFLGIVSYANIRYNRGKSKHFSSSYRKGFMPAGKIKLGSDIRICERYEQVENTLFAATTENQCRI